MVEKFREIGWSGFQWAAVRPTHWAHNPKVGGSNPPPATKFETAWRHFGDTRSEKQGRSASRCQAKRSAFVVPAHLQPSPEFFVGHVQVALRLLGAGMAQHQLDDADVDAIREEPTRALVPEVVPVQIDFADLFAVPFRSLPSWPRFDAMREQSERLPGRLDVRLIRSVRAAEHVRPTTKLRPPFENRRQPSFGVEGDPTVLFVLRRRVWDVTERSNAATEERLKSGHAVGGMSIV